MCIFTDILQSSGIFLILALVVDAGEYCTNHKTGFSEYCSGYCCSTESDNCCSDWGWIAGAVVGAIIFIAIIGTIIFLVCQKLNAKKSQTVHVQMSRFPQNTYQSSHRHTRRQISTNNNQNLFSTNTSANTFLPPPPPYSQAYNPQPGYPPPPPYPGSPLPGSNVFSGANNSYQTTQTHTQLTGDAVYPPPPVS